MDYFIIIVATATGLYFHWWIYQRVRRWIDHNLALSFAGGDPQKYDYLLQQLAEAKTSKVKWRDLSAWLECATVDHPSHEA